MQTSRKVRIKSRKKSAPHRQVEIEWRGLRAEVDEEIAPLVLELWKAGIVTTNSCQENFPGIAWIEFLSTRDAKKFLNLIVEYPVDTEEPFWETLYGRITGCGSDDAWDYNLHLYDRGVDEEVVGNEVIQNCTGPADFEYSVSIRFPRTDIPLILERLHSRARPTSRSRFSELEAKLLSFGGTEVVEMPEPHLDILLERGHLFDAKGRKRIRGELHQCHRNSVLRYVRHHSLGYGGTCEIATGYGLDEEGGWMQHSWLWDGARVIETNADFLRYYGVVLEPFEALKFVACQVFSCLPGYDRVPA
jgi:hypothetical protein